MADDYEANKVDQGQSKHGTHDVAQVQEAPVGVLDEGSLDPVYEAKARVLNKAIQDIGMGRYQWQASSYSVYVSYDTNTLASFSSLLALDGLWTTCGLL
jgi:hypothetical protein